MNAREWKAWYARERAELGERGLQDLLAAAPALDAAAAVVFPHTRLRPSGTLPAAAALAAVRSGSEEVLALGVLHGGREHDAGLVAAAKGGEALARSRIRRVHGPGVPGDEGFWTEEFSLDGFRALLEAAAQREGNPSPRLIERYPFLVGEDPASLPGLDELRAILRRGAFLVASTDPIHHGAGYGSAELRAEDDPATREYALESIRDGFGLLEQRRFVDFLIHASEEKSDFRDSGPVLAELVGPGFRLEIRDLKLVDYSDVLRSPRPTWVAAALATVPYARPRGTA